MPLCFGDRSTLPICFRLFRTWAFTHDAANAIVTSEPIRVVGEDRETLDSAHGRNKVNESITAWIALLKGIEQNKTLLDMIIMAGSPSEAWKMLLSMVGDESSHAAKY